MENLKKNLESKFGILYQEGESYICYGEKLGVPAIHTIKIKPGLKFQYITHIKLIDNYLVLFASSDLNRPVVEIDLIEVPVDDIKF